MFKELLEEKCLVDNYIVEASKMSIIVDELKKIGIRGGKFDSTANVLVFKLKKSNKEWLDDVKKKLNSGKSKKIRIDRVVKDTDTNYLATGVFGGVKNHVVFKVFSVLEGVGKIFIVANIARFGQVDDLDSFGKTSSTLESFDDSLDEEVDVKEVIKTLINTKFSGSNGDQAKAVQLMKGVAFSDDPISNKFMKMVDDFTSSIDTDELFSE